jgi:hypothetical protein
MQIFDPNSEKLKTIMRRQFTRVEKTVSKAVGLTPTTISLDKRHIVLGVLSFGLDEIEDRFPVRSKRTVLSSERRGHKIGRQKLKKPIHFASSRIASTGRI